MEQEKVTKCGGCGKTIPYERNTKRACSVRCQKRIQRGRKGPSDAVAQKLLDDLDRSLKAATATPLLDMIRREVGHKTFEQATLKLGTFCIEDIRRSQNQIKYLDDMVRKATYLVGKTITRVTVDHAEQPDPFGTLYNINLHFS